MTVIPSTHLIADLGSLDIPTDATLTKAEQALDLDYTSTLSAAKVSLYQAKNAIAELLAATDGGDPNGAILADIAASLV
jgi:hypothetical protein